MKTMKKLLVALLAMMMVFSLAACGGDNGDNGDTGAIKDTFTYALGGEPNYLDPAVASDSVGSYVLNQSYYPLFAIGADGSTVKHACVDYSVDETRTVYTFKLTENNYWSDGQKVVAGDYVYITGEMYVARDAAHQRMIEALKKGENLPINIEDSTIYYMGPSPAREGRPIGSAGPTTATRMDKYAPFLLDLGQKAMIGKGRRSQEVIDAIIRNKAVYFAAVGGAGALLAQCIKKAEVIAYDDLGTEAIRKLEVENLPVIVVIDRHGNNMYETAVEEYLNKRN